MGFTLRRRNAISAVMASVCGLRERWRQKPAAVCVCVLLDLAEGLDVLLLMGDGQG